MHSLIVATKPDLSKLPAGWQPEAVPLLNDITSPIINNNSLATVIDDLFSQQECDALIQLMQSAPELAPVNNQGNPQELNQQLGSLRSNIWSPELAETIWKKISSYVDPITADQYTLTDWWQGNELRHHWRPVAVSPLLRFMHYEKHGKHLPHYDAGFIYSDDNLRGLVSLIIYLTSHDEGGETRMIDDNQQQPIWQRNHDDWSREALDEEVQFSCAPQVGRALLFLHRRCHDVAEYAGIKPRIIIRTDIIFESC